MRGESLVNERLGLRDCRSEPLLLSERRPSQISEHLKLDGLPLPRENLVRDSDRIFFADRPQRVLAVPQDALEQLQRLSVRHRFLLGLALLRNRVVNVFGEQLW